MTETALEGFLKELQTECFGKSFVWLYETTSTIDRAEEWLSKGGPHGGVVIAGRQTRAKGRRGREWASPEGGLWMSVVTRPALEPERTGMLGLGLAVAAVQALEEVAGCGVRLRWPNDLVLGERKLGGVLVTGSPDWEGAILSVGMNVNLRLTDLPEEVRPSAATLLEVTGREHEVGGLAARLLSRLEALWPDVTGDGTRVVAEWRKRDALASREVLVEVAGRTWRGCAKGVDDGGRLLLADAGVERTISTGEVVSVRKAEG